MLPVCLDFETEGIAGRPTYPPKPVGVAIQWPGKRAKYYAWGHPAQNNCTLGDARQALELAYGHPGGILMHNAKFDVDVAHVHFGLVPKSWEYVHDTMFLLFLNDPHAPDLHLKTSAERILGLPPEEQDAVRDWLLAHQPVPGVRISESPKGKEPFGKYICQAPGDLVGRYACGDVERTLGLFKKIHPTLDEGMRRAYDRERRLLPHLLEMERTGVRVDLERMAADIASGQAAMEKVDRWFGRNLGVINVDSDQEMAEALIKAGKVDVKLLPLTPTGKPSMKKDGLELAVTDPQVLALLKYRGRLATSLRTFMEPWAATAQRSGGLIYTTWHQTRGSEGGTRTGRLSSHPNFQNVPKSPKQLFRDKQNPKLPPSPIRGLPGLPHVRSYVVAFDGQMLFDRDYAQQEYRILAHYDDGAILKRYHDDPDTDFHEAARKMVGEKLGKEMDRNTIKTMGFGLLYGMGVGLLASKLGIDVETANQIKRAYLAAVPGINELNTDFRERAALEIPLRTWGGRVYYCEPSKMTKDKTTGREVYREFSYKMLNVLIQGSAADCTKEAMVRYCETKPAHHHLIITVHDELLVSAPRGERAMEILKEAMESVEFDLPMRSDGKVSTTNWAELHKE